MAASGGFGLKRIAFVAHDPGSYDVLCPVYERLRDRAVFLTVGPSAGKYPEYLTEDWESALQCLLIRGLTSVVMGRDWGTDIDVRLIAWARKRSVKTVVVLDYWSNYADSFCDKGTPCWPDVYLVMDELARQEAVAEGVPAHLLKIVGQPGLDKFCVKAGNDCSIDRDVLFLSQPLSLLYGNSLGYTEQGVLADVVKACEECGRKLDVKFHPKDETSFRQQYQDVSVDGDVDELMRHYRLVVGMSTMALLHAALMGVPIVSYQPNLIGKDGCITNRLGLSRCLKSYGELRGVLSGVIRGTPVTVGEMETQPWLDGRSAQRAAKAVEEIVESCTPLMR